MFSLKPAELKINILSGLTVSLALVQEAIAFALVAHVSPLTGLYAAFIVCLITAIFGGRPGMISGRAGGRHGEFGGSPRRRIPVCLRDFNGPAAVAVRPFQAGKVHPHGALSGHAWLRKWPGHCDFHGTVQPL